MKIARASVLALVLLAGCESCGKTPVGQGTPAPDAAVASARSPAQIRSEGNHLTGAGSLYLRMHANNPPRHLFCKEPGLGIDPPQDCQSVKSSGGGMAGQGIIEFAETLPTDSLAASTKSFDPKTCTLK